MAIYTQSYLFQSPLTLCVICAVSAVVLNMSLICYTCSQSYNCIMLTCSMPSLCNILVTYSALQLQGGGYILLGSGHSIKSKSYWISKKNYKVCQMCDLHLSSIYWPFYEKQLFCFMAELLLENLFIWFWCLLSS